jgi:predicted nicotinamide N-methyase
MSDRQIERMKELAVRYPLVDIGVRAAGRLWRITGVQDQDALIQGVQTDEDLVNFPYGLMLWPSAVGLAEWLAHASQIQGKRILEIGAGVGLAGLAARALGAEVTQTDFQRDALTLCRHNATQNRIDGIHVMRGDWRAFPANLMPADIVIGSDILYERSLHGVLETLFPQLIGRGGRIVLSDPLRPQALEFMERLEARGRWSLSMEGLEIAWDEQRRDIALFVLRKK